jgi:hypothetical protein
MKLLVFFYERNVDDALVQKKSGRMIHSSCSKLFAAVVTTHETSHGGFTIVRGQYIFLHTCEKSSRNRQKKLHQTCFAASAVMNDKIPNSQILTDSNVNVKCLTREFLMYFTY